MHRHGYRGRKFGRERDQRNALMRGLACSLITHQSIKTTTPKAKELRPFVEKLVTAAKKGDLANRRLVIARLADIKVGNLLVDQIAPQIKRDSGYLRITKLDENRVPVRNDALGVGFRDDEIILPHHPLHRGRFNLALHLAPLLLQPQTSKMTKLAITLAQKSPCRLDPAQ